jgi:hypothetical protein
MNDSLLLGSVKKYCTSKDISLCESFHLQRSAPAFAPDGQMAFDREPEESIAKAVVRSKPFGMRREMLG